MFSNLRYLAEFSSESRERDTHAHAQRFHLIKTIIRSVQILSVPSGRYQFSLLPEFPRSCRTIGGIKQRAMATIYSSDSIEYTVSSKATIDNVSAVTPPPESPQNSRIRSATRRIQRGEKNEDNKKPLFRSSARSEPSHGKIRIPRLYNGQILLARLKYARPRRGR